MLYLRKSLSLSLLKFTELVAFFGSGRDLMEYMEGLWN